MYRGRGLWTGCPAATSSSGGRRSIRSLASIPRSRAARTSTSAGGFARPVGRWSECSALRSVHHGDPTTLQGPVFRRAVARPRQPARQLARAADAALSAKRRHPGHASALRSRPSRPGLWPRPSATASRGPSSGLSPAWASRPCGASRLLLRVPRQEGRLRQAPRAWAVAAVYDVARALALVVQRQPRRPEEGLTWRDQRVIGCSSCAACAARAVDPRRRSCSARRRPIRAALRRDRLLHPRSTGHDVYAWATERERSASTTSKSSSATRSIPGSSRS